jgi:hypothetical protein
MIILQTKELQGTQSTKPHPNHLRQANRIQSSMPSCLRLQPQKSEKLRVY